MSNEVVKRKVPTVNELYSENLEVLSKQNDLNILLNQEPKPDWIKDHPIAKKVKYIPIERIEWLLTNIYVKWRVEILREGVIANSAYCTIRLHYLEPITNEWDWIDGTGAAPMQTDKDASATDWSKIKSDAVMKALPAAESYAIKDAAEKLGKLFGKDLNRADKIMYDTLGGKFGNLETKLNELIEVIENLPNIDDQETYRDILQAKRKAGELTIELIEGMIKDIKK